MLVELFLQTFETTKNFQNINFLFNFIMMEDIERITYLPYYTGYMLQLDTTIDSIRSIVKKL